MNLIKIEKAKFKNKEINTVNARNLHKGLESKQDFSTWIKSRLEGFIENTDYIRLHKKVEANNATMIEYFLTIETAKNIAMMERNEKGHEVRKYFIAMEKKATQNSDADFFAQLNLVQHTNERVQKQNSKLINAIKFHNGGVEDIKKYNRENCVIHTGLTPQEVKSDGKKQGLKSKDISSAKAVLRRTKPAKACMMSLADSIQSHNLQLNLAQISTITLQTEGAYNAMLKLGIRIPELEC
jgi:phage anti-repressor protein